MHALLLNINYQLQQQQRGLQRGLIKWYFTLFLEKGAEVKQWQIF
jgi:hypothetical protein